MNGLLEDLRIVEISAFVAAPLGGMTMAQMGADVIRIDPIGGGIDYRRWPVTGGGASLYWAGLNKAKRSLALALDKPEGRDIARAIITAPGAGGGILLTNLPPARGLDFAALKAARNDLIMLRLTGHRDGPREHAVDTSDRISGEQEPVYSRCGGRRRNAGRGTVDLHVRTIAADIEGMRGRRLPPIDEHEPIRRSQQQDIGVIRTVDRPRAVAISGQISERA